MLPDYVLIFSRVFIAIISFIPCPILLMRHVIVDTDAAVDWHWMLLSVVIIVIVLGFLTIAYLTCHRRDDDSMYTLQTSSL